MNIRELRYIVAVEQAGSINRAATNLYVSQSSISRAIQEVEAQIGISLFQRTTKGVIPTHDGKEFIERLKQILFEIDELEGRYFSPSNNNQETLLVATQRCSPVIQSFIDYYMKRCIGKENLNLAIKEDTTDNIIHMVSSKIYSIGVLHYTSDQEHSFLQKCKSVDLETHLLEASRVAVQVSTGHPFTRYKTVSLDKLSPYPHVTFSDEDITNINYCSDVSQYNPNILKKRIVIQDRGTLKEIISKTDSYYIGCDFTRFSTGTNPNVYIPLEGVSFTLNTIWVKNRGRALSEAEQAFINELEDKYSTHS
ncbi:MAG: LysR family transcriptional regulator [Eubacteriales bacterium]|nr:LysR family transcriptional regulator [Eubacteriales bacterium]